ncbi:hypothetical protein VNO77_12661 [Canavalia gladiata]|uniref:Uncharacterized protein n=1 Tax=Canavalia gladiata TaxID=3824 RepID=A0AAN9M1N4_CANGL
MSAQNEELGTIPKNLSELLARTADEYKWSSEKLEKIEKGLKKQNWNKEQLDHIEKTIRDEKWTPKEIVEVEKAYYEQNINGEFFVNHHNDKLCQLGGGSVEIEIKIRCT